MEKAKEYPSRITTRFHMTLASDETLVSNQAAIHFYENANVKKELKIVEGCTHLCLQDKEYMNKIVAEVIAYQDKVITESKQSTTP